MNIRLEELYVNICIKYICNNINTDIKLSVMFIDIMTNNETKQSRLGHTNVYSKMPNPESFSSLDNLCTLFWAKGNVTSRCCTKQKHQLARIKLITVNFLHRVQIVAFTEETHSADIRNHIQLPFLVWCYCAEGNTQLKMPTPWELHNAAPLSLQRTHHR